MRRGWLRRGLAACLAVALLLPLLVAAQTPGAGDAVETPAKSLERWNVEASEIEEQFEVDPPGLPEIEAMRQVLGRQIETIPGIKSGLESQLQPLRDQVEALGAPPEDPAAETAEISEERSRLLGSMSELEAVVKLIDQAAARASGLDTRLADLGRQRFTEQLLERGPGLFDDDMPWEGFVAVGRKAHAIWLETVFRATQLSLDAETLTRLGLPVLLLVGALLILLRIKDTALRWLYAQINESSRKSRRVAVGVGITLARLLLPAGAVVLILGGLVLSGLFGGQGTSFLIGIGRAALLVITAFALGSAYFSPSSKLLRLSTLSDREALVASRWLLLLAVVVGLNRAFVVQGEEMRLAVEGLALLNIALLLPGGVALWGLVRYVCTPAKPKPETPTGEDDDETPPPSGEAGTVRIAFYLARWLCRAIALASPVLAILGYYALARYLFFPLAFSGALIGICVLLFYVVSAIVSEIVSDRGGETPALARLQLIPILVGFVLVCAAAPVLALIWGMSVSELQDILRQILAGYSIGGVTVSLTDFLAFLLVLFLGVFVTGRFKRLLKGTVLPLTGLDTGGRDAIAAGAGYLGIVVTVLLAISTTGLDLSNLAIVAGALSVGIGFGLQNIVNNFVSGVILLIERPIKAGDWIELPSGMGYVKNINVRSTEVQTFDRSSLFVPNSQLISENVINWTHSNLHGRIIVKIGVDYESDPRRVERVLLEIARAHPLMLRRPAPYVLFRGFGADALEFEIRGILRDVNWVLNVQSDIHFEIARRFREEGINVPFRQSDIALKNPQEIAEALATLLRDGRAGSGPAAIGPGGGAGAPGAPGELRRVVGGRAGQSGPAGFETGEGDGIEGER